MNHEETHHDPVPLRRPCEPMAVEVVNAGGKGSAVLLCDHASHLVPRRLRTLGLDPRWLTEHIGWDPGAAEVARELSRRLDAPLVLSGYSRLVIDCNRPLDSAESIAERSAGVTIPGNRGFDPWERERRVLGVFEPYHHAISELLDGRGRRATALLAIHSFTPVLDGEYRPWSVGISYGRDRRLAEPLLRVLAHDSDIVVGDNQPYAMDPEVDYTLPTHGERRGLPHAMIEIREDGIRTAAGVVHWAARLAEAYRRTEIEAAMFPPRQAGRGPSIGGPVPHGR